MSAVCSWPGLGQTLLTYVQKEVERSKGTKRGPEASIFRTVKKFFQHAEAARKQRVPNVLQSRAARIFALVHRIILSATLKTGLGEDFGGLLRQHLLSVTTYAKAATPDTFQGSATVSSQHLPSLPTDPKLSGA